MLALGFSINLLTLLALVLAIGLVVDDAIIVVENVNRHLEEGMAPIAAAIAAARELGGPIIAMTVVLVAVYVPIGFQGGLTGALFTEFAFTLVGAVTVSAIVALTLSPMMCSRAAQAARSASDGGWEAQLTAFIDRSFTRLRGGYERRLHGSLNTLPVTLVFALIVLGSIYFLFAGAKTELAPQEDQGVIIALSTRGAERHAAAAAALFAPGLQDLRRLSGDRARVSDRCARASRIAGMVLKPWDERNETTNAAAAGAAAGAEPDRRRARSPRSSRRRCPAASACRCSS